MAFPTGHNQPAGFVAGQLKDGSSFGTIDVGSFGGQPVKFKIDLRYYRNKLVAISSVLKPDGVTVISPAAIVQRQYLLNIVQLALPNDITTLKTLAPLVADEAGLSSVGLSPTQNVPTNATGDLIPFAMNADGKVESFISAADTAKATVAAAAKTNEVLTQLVSSVTGGNAATGGTTTTSGTGTTPTGWAAMSTTVKVVIGVVVAAVIGGIVYMVMKPGKKGGKK